MLSWQDDPQLLGLTHFPDSALQLIQTGMYHRAWLQYTLNFKHVPKAQLLKFLFLKRENGKVAKSEQYLYFFITRA